MIQQPDDGQEGEAYEYAMRQKTDPLTFYRDFEPKDDFCLSKAKANGLLERI